MVLGHNFGTSFEEARRLKIITKQAFSQELKLHGGTEKKINWKYLKGKMFCYYQQGQKLKEKWEG